jgi:5,10-methenyltetrahydromethanopterin hydrogenase
MADKLAIRSLSIKEIAEALKGAPEAWPKLKAALLKALDALIAAVPATLKPGLQALRDALAEAATVPADLIEQVLAALKGAVLAMDFGPATGDDSDLA